MTRRNIQIIKYYTNGHALRCRIILLRVVVIGVLIPTFVVAATTLVVPVGMTTMITLALTIGIAGLVLGTTPLVVTTSTKCTNTSLKDRRLFIELKPKPLFVKNQFGSQIIKCVTTRQHGIDSSKTMIVGRQTRGHELNQL